MWTQVSQEKSENSVCRPLRLAQLTSVQVYMTAWKLVITTAIWLLKKMPSSLCLCVCHLKKRKKEHGIHNNAKNNGNWLRYQNGLQQCTKCEINFLFWAMNHNNEINIICERIQTWIWLYSWEKYIFLDAPCQKKLFSPPSGGCLHYWHACNIVDPRSFHDALSQYSKVTDVKSATNMVLKMQTLLQKLHHFTYWTKLIKLVPWSLACYILSMWYTFLSPFIFSNNTVTFQEFSQEYNWRMLQ